MQISYIKILLLFLLSAILSLSSCSGRFSKSKHPIDTLFEKHERIQLKKYQMKLVATGVVDEENISTLSLHYIAFKKMKPEEVRTLLVTNVEDFLRMINHNEEIRPQLKEHPITYKDLKFNIGFGTISGGFQSPPHVAYAYLDDGLVYYCFLDRYFQQFTDEQDIVEPYTTAQKIVFGEEGE